MTDAVRPDHDATGSRPSVGGAAPEYVAELNLAEWRERQGLTWQALADLMGWSGPSQARRIALGVVEASPLEREMILRKTDGVVGLFALHRQRLHYVRAMQSVPDISDPRAAVMAAE